MARKGNILTKPYKYSGVITNIPVLLYNIIKHYKAVHTTQKSVNCQKNLTDVWNLSVPEDRSICQMSGVINFASFVYFCILIKDRSIRTVKTDSNSEKKMHLTCLNFAFLAIFVF